jgi:hypothetical protein
MLRSELQHQSDQANQRSSSSDMPTVELEVLEELEEPVELEDLEMVVPSEELEPVVAVVVDPDMEFHKDLPLAVLTLLPEVMVPHLRLTEPHKRWSRRFYLTPSLHDF